MLAYITRVSKGWDLVISDQSPDFPLFLPYSALMVRNISQISTSRWRKAGYSGVALATLLAGAGYVWYASKEGHKISLDEEPKSPTVPLAQPVSPTPTADLAPIMNPIENDTLSEFKVVLNATRQEVHHHFHSSLTSVITDMKGRSGLSKNVGKVFSKGLVAYQDQISLDPSFASERISILKHPKPLKADSVIQSPQLPKINFTQAWMDYSNSNHTFDDHETVNITFANFANRVLGGAWMGGSTAQEEQMALRSPEFALILARYNSRISEQRSLFTRSVNSAKVGSADPILITGLKFLLTQDDETAKDLKSIHGKDFDEDAFYTVEKSTPAVSMIAMAAPQFSGSKINYSPILMSDLVNNAFSAFSLVKKYDLSQGKKTRVVTGRWGAGVFGHNLLVSIAAQTMGARMAGLEEVVFSGIAGSDDEKGAVDLANQIYDGVLNKETDPILFRKKLVLELTKQVNERGWKTAH